MNNFQSPQTNSHHTAEQLISDGRYKESREILTKLLIEDPSDHVATHMLGLLAKKKQSLEPSHGLFYESD